MKKKSNKKQYDLAFGFGTTCGCSITLRRAKLQFLSFPGDWTAPVWCDAEHPFVQHGLCLRASTLCRGIDGFLDAKDMHFLRTHAWNGKDIYYNAKTSYYFNHDFPAGGDFGEELPKIQEKYSRRYQRLVNLIRSSRRVLVVRIDAPSGKNWPTTTLDDCRVARKMLNERFAPTVFDFALFSCEKNRPFAEMKDELTEDGIYHWTFDYSDTRPGADPLLPDISLTSRILSERFAVTDYRTPEEIAANKAASRRKRWARVGASGPFGYYLRKALLALKRPFVRQDASAGDARKASR